MALRAKLHTAWSSVLLDTDLTGPVTISRNNVVLGVIPAGQLVYYDHYPTPLGALLTYKADNGTTQQTTTITVPARTDRRAWLKSASDPNLSLGVLHTDPLEYQREVPRGVYPLVGSSETFVTRGPMRLRTGTLSLTVDSPAARDALEALIDAGTVYYQPPAANGDTEGWLSLGSVTVTHPVMSVGIRRFSVPFVELPAPSFDPSRVVIPGWSWTDVAAVWASWTATAAANVTWVDLVRYGVT